MELGIALPHVGPHATPQAILRVAREAEQIGLGSVWVLERLLRAIAATDLRAFLAWLRSDYKPRRFDGSSLPLSAKTLRNYWVTLSAFFRWASAEFGLTNPMRSVPAPHFEEAPSR